MTKRQITITECDRCGVEAGEITGILKLLSESYDQWDLCFYCQNHLKRWMRKE